jgi:hypothetical protein
VSLHGKKGLGKKDKKKWHCDKILVHLKEFAPDNFLVSSLNSNFLSLGFVFPSFKSI